MNENKNLLQTLNNERSIINNAPNNTSNNTLTNTPNTMCKNLIHHNTTEPLEHLSTHVRHSLAVTKRGCDELLVESEWVSKLQNAEKTGRALRIKLGLDPTAPDIHLGHTVVLTKLRQLQDLGHQVIFLIGDFTSLIGDPSGRNATRPPLSPEEIKRNAETYHAQALKILDASRTEIRYNSEWSMPLGADGMIRLASRYTVARMLERDDFTKRFATGVPISLHEFLYPLMQGLDSVALNADLELGGTDQKFNLLVGRELQKQEGQEPQCILTMPLLVGTDGVDKMSKSKGNYIGVSESAESMFGKLMSISDDLMWRYFELLSLRPFEEIKALREACEAGANPRNAKVTLAQEIITRYHSQQAAEKALIDFEARFKHGGIPDNLPVINLTGAPLSLTQVLKQSGLSPSSTEANRNIEQRAVKIDSQLCEDKTLKLTSGSYVIQVGKRKFARINLT